MADPLKKTITPAAKETPPPAPAPEIPADPNPPPQDAAQSEAAAFAAEQGAEFRRARKGSPTAIMPMGRRIDASPYVKARYVSRTHKLGQAFVLGAPEEIVKEDYRRRKPGYHYTWPIASNLQTQAYLASGVYEAVPFEEIDRTNPMAAVAQSPEGNTTWMQHILVGVPPRWWDALKLEPERESIRSVSMNRASVEAELNAQFAKGGYAAEVEEGVDSRDERVL